MSAAATPVLLAMSAPPYWHCGRTIRQTSLYMLAGLAPAIIMSIWNWGLPAARVMALCVATSVLTEALCQKTMGRELSVDDFTAVNSGLLLAFLLPADQEIGPGDKRILSRLRSDFAVKRDDGTFKWKVPLIAIVTKIDELDRSALIDKLIEINEFADFTDIVPVSALEHDNLAEVRNVLVENMPEGPQMYPAEQITEERPEDTIAELIRGAFLEELDDELPHSLAVVVDSIEYPEDNDSGESYAGKAQVIVSIYVERDSQKPIIIGHNAEHLVRVKKKLRTAVNRIVGQKAKLDLHVKVAKGWQSDPKQLEKLGF